MSLFFYYNDKFYKQGTPVINADNRSFRYGDGLFETIKSINGKLLLRQYHFERLFAGMQTLQFTPSPHFTQQYLVEKIHALCKKNGHTNTARIRLTVFRGEGGLYDAQNNLPHYIIESWEIPNERTLNENGLVIDIFNDSKKSCDIFSNIKTNNFLPYAMAAMFARGNKFNDAVLFNVNNKLCDTTIANIFIIKDEIIYTPPLSEGCIAGVARRWLLENLYMANFKVIEKPLEIADLQNADEVFTSNSIRDIRWVKQFKNKEYTSHIIQKIHVFYCKSVS